MRAPEFIRDHVTFKLPFDFSYQMKTPLYCAGWGGIFPLKVLRLPKEFDLIVNSLLLSMDQAVYKVLKRFCPYKHRLVVTPIHLVIHADLLNC